MEDPEENVESLQRNRVLEFFHINWHIFNTILLFLGIVMTIAGAVSYYDVSEIQHAVILAAGLFVSFVALAVYTIKGLELYRLLQQAEESKFDAFRNQSADATVSKELAQSPDLEMNDQHLPSGILRLQEES